MIILLLWLNYLAVVQVVELYLKCQNDTDYMWHNLNEQKLAQLEKLSFDITKLVERSRMRNKIQAARKERPPFHCLHLSPTDIIVKIMTENYLTGFENLFIIFSCRVFF